MTRDTAFGQLLDIRSAVRPVEEVTEEEVLTVHRLKTSVYTVASPLRIGAILGGASAPLLRDLDSIGVDLGIAFQLRDDILGAGFDEGRSGKSANDLIEGKRTLLIVHAYDRCDASGRLAIRSVLGHADADPEQVRSVQKLIESTGSLAYSEARIDSLARRAFARIGRSRALAGPDRGAPARDRRTVGPPGDLTPPPPEGRRTSGRNPTPRPGARHRPGPMEAVGAQARGLAGERSAGSLRWGGGGTGGSAGADLRGLQLLGEVALHSRVAFLEGVLLPLDGLQADLEGFLVLGEQVLDLLAVLGADHERADRAVDRRLGGEALDLLERVGHLAELEVELDALLVHGAQVLLDPLELLDVVLELRWQRHGAGRCRGMISASEVEVTARGSHAPGGRPARSVRSARASRGRCSRRRERAGVLGGKLQPDGGLFGAEAGPAPAGPPEPPPGALAKCRLSGAEA